MLTQVMRAMASSLQTPVIVVLIALVCVTVVTLGMLVAEIFTERRQFKVSLSRLVDDLKRDADAFNVVEESGLLRRQKDMLQELLRHPNISPDARESLAVNLVSREQSKLDARVKVTDLIAKIAPMFGLMGTLIPLGPGLIGIGEGQTEVLSESLLIAFDTTVLGLIVAAVALCVSTVRKSWYKRYMAAFEASAEVVLERANELGTGASSALAPQRPAPSKHAENKGGITIPRGAAEAKPREGQIAKGAGVGKGAVQSSAAAKGTVVAKGAVQGSAAAKGAGVSKGATQGAAAAKGTAAAVSKGTAQGAAASKVATQGAAAAKGAAQGKTAARSVNQTGANSKAAGQAASAAKAVAQSSAATKAATQGKAVTRGASVDGAAVASASKTSEKTPAKAVEQASQKGKASAKGETKPSTAATGLSAGSAPLKGATKAMPRVQTSTSASQTTQEMSTVSEIDDDDAFDQEPPIWEKPLAPRGSSGGYFRATTPEPKHRGRKK